MKPDFRRLAGFVELIPKFASYLVDEESCSALTARAYGLWLRKFFSYLQDTRELNIGPENVDRQLALDFLVHLRDAEGLSEQTCACQSICLRRFFKWLYQVRHIRTHVLETLPIPKIPKTLPRPLLPAEISALLLQPDTSTFMGRRDLAMMEVMYGSGLRISETVNLCFRDLQLTDDMAGPTVRLFGKGGYPRAVPLTTEAIGALESYFELRGQGQRLDPIFTIGSGKRALSTRAVQLRLAGYSKAIMGKGGFTPHRLRHSFASHLYANGAPIEIVSSLLGHHQISTTQIYAEVTPVQVFKAYRKASFRENLPSRSYVAAIPAKPDFR